MTARRRRIRATSSGRSSTLRVLSSPAGSAVASDHWDRWRRGSRSTRTDGPGADADRSRGTTRRRARSPAAARRAPGRSTAIAPSVGPVGSRSGRTRASRSTNRVTAGLAAIASASAPPAVATSDGSASGSSMSVRSPRMPSGVRPVARIVSMGHRSSKAGRNATADATRSTGSSTASVRPSASASWSRSRMSAPCPSPTPNAAAISGSRSSGSSTGSRSTQDRPANGSASPRATWRARRVLPTPPVPTIVLSRWMLPSTSAPSVDTSRSRPTIGVGIAAGNTAGQRGTVGRVAV